MFNLPKIIDFYQDRKRQLSGVKVFGPIYIRLYLVFLAIINVLAWLSARFIYTEIDQERMALHYNVDFGIDNYGETSKIFNLPLMGLIIIILNLLIYLAVLKHKDRVFISHILFIASVIANSILLVAIALIYLVNFS